MPREKKRRQTVRRREKPILWRNSREGFQRFLREVVVTLVAGNSVHANEQDNRPRASARGRRILKGCAAHIQAAKRRGIGRAVKESAALRIRVVLQKVIKRVLRGAKIPRIQCGLVGI